MRRALSLAFLALVAGCGSDFEGDRPVSAIATTAHVADFARNVGGRRVEVRGLVSGSSDPHDYEPRPSDARAVAEADLVIRSGGDLDEWLGDVLAGAGEDVPEVSLIDSVRTIDDDPHWWQDPRNVVLAAEAIRDALIEVDPGGRPSYERNAAAYLRRLRALDRFIADCIGRIPAARRKLVTTHDSYSYFARRYGLEMIGALIPSLSTQAQPSAKDTIALVEQIEREGVRAIFPESAINAELEEAVARDAGATVGGALWADSLPADGSYESALIEDTTTIVDGLSGRRVRCRPGTLRAG